MSGFSHLHVHTQYSLLDGASAIPALLKKAVEDKMPAIAITDHGNMFGVFNFVAEARKYNTPEKTVIKPIVGCEFYLVEDRFRKQFTKDKKDQRYHQLLLAKNSEGYKNLSRLCSLGYIEGMYGKYPRIDKELLKKYHKGLIATSCCLAAEIPRAILREGVEVAETKLKWWLDLFGEDFYIELQRHDIPEQEHVNQVLLQLANKYNVKVIATNDVHYIDQSDAFIHDIMLCVNTGEKLSTPKVKEFIDDDVFVKNKRFAFYNDQFYFRTQEEMKQKFSDLPEAIDNTNDIVDKVELLQLEKDILLPAFPVPPEFKIYEDDNLNQWEYLKHLTYEGATRRYKEITPEIEERIRFELFTIKTMGFAGYFLIVWDFIRKGKEIGVFVGPGRGSAAGSVVAYCIGITNIDPIRYGLLFERFLNPDRKSMPDIDTDFDDEGRQKVIDYVVQKYGENQVAQIITYATMAPKMSVRDVARVMELPLQEADYLSKLIPSRVNSFKRILHAPLEGEDGLMAEDKENLSMDEIVRIKKLREIYAGNDLKAEVLKNAEKLEGTIRGTGVHAAGILIAPTDMMDIIPVCTAKDSSLRISQFDGKVIENAGIIKMDFLGLKNLSIIRDALQMIKENHNVEIDLDNIPLDDKETLELFQRGETNGIFQFESDGMKANLIKLKPDKFEDLIAMNALYRPGPMKYIDQYIRRKHGEEPITYDLPEMQEYLEETYGITVYQEQVMLLAQKLAGFTKGEADTLRKAMGKKQKSVLDKMKNKFIENGTKNNFPEATLQKIWSDWEDFAKYAFNKSHSTCYAFLAFQTAYLKAHYPNEYMAALLTHNLDSIEQVTFFIEECRRMMIPVLGPDVNESKITFTVNKKGEVRFGLAAIKGVGEAAASAIIEEREKNGPYLSVYDFSKRLGGNKINKKVVESLVYAGAMDNFQLHRAQYFFKSKESESTFIENLIRYGNRVQEAALSATHSLFGEEVIISQINEPAPPHCEPWSTLEKLNYEKEYVGFYLSGHPLDKYRYILQHIFKTDINHIQQLLNNPSPFSVNGVKIGGLITSVEHKINKQDQPYGRFLLEDFDGKMEFYLFKDQYLKFKHLLAPDLMVFLIMDVKKSKEKDKPMVYIKDMGLIDNYPQNFCKSLSLFIHLNHFDETGIRSLENILQEHKGNKPIYIILEDHHTRLKMLSQKYKVALSVDLFNQLNTLKQVRIKVE